MVHGTRLPSEMVHSNFPNSEIDIMQHVTNEETLKLEKKARSTGIQPHDAVQSKKGQETIERTPDGQSALLDDGMPDEQPQHTQETDTIAWDPPTLDTEGLSSPERLVPTTKSFQELRQDFDTKEETDLTHIGLQHKTSENLIVQKEDMEHNTYKDSSHQSEEQKSQQETENGKHAQPVFAKKGVLDPETSAGDDDESEPSDHLVGRPDPETSAGDDDESDPSDHLVFRLVDTDMDSLFEESVDTTQISDYKSASLPAVFRWLDQSFAWMENPCQNYASIFEKRTPRWKLMLEEEKKRSKCSNVIEKPVISFFEKKGMRGANANMDAPEDTPTEDNPEDDFKSPHSNNFRTIEDTKEMKSSVIAGKERMRSPVCSTSLDDPIAVKTSITQSKQRIIPDVSDIATGEASAVSGRPDPPEVCKHNTQQRVASSRDEHCFLETSNSRLCYSMDNPPLDPVVFSQMNEQDQQAAIEMARKLMDRTRELKENRRRRQKQRDKILTTHFELEHLIEGNRR